MVLHIVVDRRLKPVYPSQHHVVVERDFDKRVEPLQEQILEGLVLQEFIDKRVVLRTLGVIGAEEEFRGRFGFTLLVKSETEVDVKVDEPPLAVVFGRLEYPDVAAVAVVAPRQNDIIIDNAVDADTFSNVVVILLNGQIVVFDEFPERAPLGAG